MSILSDLNPEALALKVLASAAVAVIIFTWGHHVGYTGEKAAYDLYVSQQAEKAEAQVASNKSALVFQQTQFQLAQNKLQQDHQDETIALAAQRDAAIADGANYASRLRYYLAHPSVRPAIVPDSATGTGQSAATGQDSAGLSDGVSNLNWYLTQRFHTADVNAVTLNEAIDLLAKDREMCNGSLPGITK